MSGGDRGWISDVRDLVGALAGLVAAVYVLGGIVIALRLFAARLPALTVVGGLPRESLVAVGLAQVLGVALVAAALVAGLLFSVDRRRPPRRHFRFNHKTNKARETWRAEHALRVAQAAQETQATEGHKAVERAEQRQKAVEQEVEPGSWVLHILESAVLTIFLLGPAVGSALITDTTPWRWELLLGAGCVIAVPWVLLYMHLRARIRERFATDWQSVRRVLLSAALVGGLLLPNLVAFWSVQPLQAALACVEPPVGDHPGVLVGETEKRLYVGEPPEASGDERRTLVSFPADTVRELYVGNDDAKQSCGKSSKSQPPTITKLTARSWHGRVLLSFRLSRAARVTAILWRNGTPVRAHPFTGHAGLNRLRLGRQDGSALPQGRYQLELSARDAGAGPTKAAPITIRG